VARTFLSAAFAVQTCSVPQVRRSLANLGIPVPAVESVKLQCSHITDTLDKSPYSAAMTSGLKRFHQSGQSHFITVSCYRRKPNFSSPHIYAPFLDCMERMRVRFEMCIYAYVVMPEHVHFLVSEPTQETLADAMHFLKLSFTKRLHHKGSFWQKRYYDRNVRDAGEFDEKLVYIHRNPVSRGLAREPADWKWSSFRHYALREIGIVTIESEWTARDRERPEGTPRVFLNPG
jgi:putative transposase